MIAVDLEIASGDLVVEPDALGSARPGALGSVVITNDRRALIVSIRLHVLTIAL
jgi:hypothetical protein